MLYAPRGAHMTRAIGVALVIGLLQAAHPSSAPQTPAGPAAADLVSTWTLTTLERSAGGGPAARVANPRGLLILDRAGNVFEFVTSLATQRGGQVPLAEAQAAFAGYGGFWGQYRADPAQRTVTYRAEHGTHPNLGGREFSRSFVRDENRLTNTPSAAPNRPNGTPPHWERPPPPAHPPPDAHVGCRAGHPERHAVDMGARAPDRHPLAALPQCRRLLAPHRGEAGESSDRRERRRNTALAERDRLHAGRVRRRSFPAA